MKDEAAKRLAEYEEKVKHIDSEGAAYPARDARSRRRRAAPRTHRSEGNAGSEMEARRPTFWSNRRRRRARESAREGETVVRPPCVRREELISRFALRC